MLLIDAHEDLAYNILTFGRDYTLSVAETRQKEAGTETPTRNGNTLLGWREYQLARTAVVFSTLFAAPANRKEETWDRLAYTDYEEAHQVYTAQVDCYYRLVDDHPEHFHLILDGADLDSVLQVWQALSDTASTVNPGEDTHPDDKPVPAQQVQREEGEPAPPPGIPVGLVLLMEGAEGVRDPGELEQWWEWGVRIIGPAWTGTRFCGGTRAPGPLTKDGYALLDGMADLNFGLDISHMDEAAVLQALDHYPGTIIASHANAWSLLRTDTNRHLSDRVIHGLIERDGVIGVVVLNSFLKGGWRRGDHREAVTLQHVVAHIDTICQMAGDARHVGIGSDFDGGFGVESVPVDVDSIADLRKLIPLLAEKGYSNEDIAAIMGLNWLRPLRKVLPPGKIHKEED
jgi:membrane dipeptidase